MFCPARGESRAWFGENLLKQTEAEKQGWSQPKGLARYPQPRRSWFILVGVEREVILKEIDDGGLSAR